MTFKSANYEKVIGLCFCRAYRIGQSRDVRMYRLISSGCIEENIYLRQLYKILLNKGCVENEDAKRLFNNDEIFGIDNIFKLNVGNECETKSIFKRTAVTETRNRWIGRFGFGSH